MALLSTFRAALQSAFRRYEEAIEEHMEPFRHTGDTIASRSHKSMIQREYSSSDIPVLDATKAMGTQMACYKYSP